ncbi:hypothetical protein FOH10_17650 [Nocardia otitidiscaviarum]|uniref:DUF8175 domain-containing protein n=1 Tax=Nocardia otitidiscaviarum TaxID=1823 RepID=A0A516NMX1_9NOCA|nr:hypothetical protein [Nocardia otitidiscaviarum]MCP9624477.1 hypothetical protein [Nocardia otitidiscaviarum]QDP80263.1 hypothetical protein FOH10_17650 [Nocardia otitidiscaviarum]
MAPTHAPARLRRAVGVLGVAVLATAGCDGEVADPSAPSGVRWQVYQGVSLPHTDQGPSSDSGGAATGFERSRAGAAVAAITHTIRLLVATDTQWPTVLDAAAVPGPARDGWAVTRTQLSIAGPAAPEYAPRLLGFRITGYTEDRSTVDVYTEYADSSRAVSHTTVEWFRDDWRLRLPEPDSTAPTVEAIDELPTDIVTVEAPK